MLTCDFAFCVYQKDGSCILSSVDINSVGMCDSAIIIDLPEGELWQRKMELLKKIECQEREWEDEKP